MQPLRLHQALADEDGVEAFQIGENHQLLQRRMVADITLCIGVNLAPLFGGLAKEGDIEQVRFVGLDKQRLCFGDCGRNERLANGIGVDEVIDLGEDTLAVPADFETAVS